jgi:hypothetical protein
MTAYRGFSITCLALMLLGWPLPAISREPLPELTPDWSVRIENGRVNLLANRFAEPGYPQEFPLRTIRILHGEESEPSDSSLSFRSVMPRIRVTAALLRVGSDGVPISDTLRFTSRERVSYDGSALLSDIPGLEAVAESLTGFSGWIRSPDGRWAALFEEAGYAILDIGTLRELARGSYRVMGAVFSDDSDLLAMVEYDNDPDQEQWPEEDCLSRLSVWDRSGSVVNRTPWHPGGTYDVKFSARGHPLLCVQEDGDELLGWDFQGDWKEGTGILGFVSGTKIELSRDGKTLVTGIPDCVSAYVLEDGKPCAPRLRSRYTLDRGRVSACAVSDDGALVAVEIYERYTEPPFSPTHALVLDRDLHALATIPTRSALRLEFVGDCLFVWDSRSSSGMTWPISASQSITCYDLSALK